MTDAVQSAMSFERMAVINPSIWERATPVSGYSTPAPSEETVTTGILVRKLLDITLTPSLGALEDEKARLARWRQIIALRYGLQDGKTRTFKEIGRILGVTAQTVSQTEKIILARLRWTAQRIGYPDGNDA